MKNSKNGSGRPSIPAKVKPARDVEYDGHITEKNLWFKIGLSPVEAAALRKIHQRIYMKPAKKKLAETLRAMILTGMAHFDTLHEQIYSDAEYCRKEGFFANEHYLDEIIAHRFNLKPVGIDHWA
jgi:hypothetical protein